MASLPDLIALDAPSAAVDATVAVPGSKSVTNRALILAALAHGDTVLRGALWSEDTQIMVEALCRLGYRVTVAEAPEEPGNRTLTVGGRGGAVPAGGSAGQPLELHVGNAGTAARFLAALLCLGQGVYRLAGVPRMHERPQAALFAALRELGYRVESANDRLPVTIHGGGRRPGRCRVSLTESSQFASALFLAAATGGWDVAVDGENEEESSYVQMTRALCRAFPVAGGEFGIEPDASSGSYFWAAGTYRLASPGGDPWELGRAGPLRPRVTVPDWPTSGWQIDARFRAWMERFARASVGGGVYSEESVAARYGAGWRARLAALERDGFERLQASRRTDLGDSIMTAMALAPLALLPCRFTDLGRLRVQECERVAALRTELTRCGASVVEEGDTLTVHPSVLHGAEIETYGDHRMAMCFAILGLKVPGLKIKNPACVKKTFPSFFQKLAAPPPAGLGVAIRDGRTGRALGGEELRAG